MAGAALTGGCARCGAAPAETGEAELEAPSAMKACGRCRLVAYCSRECQVAHWKKHKGSCQAAR